MKVFKGYIYSLITEKRTLFPKKEQDMHYENNRKIITPFESIPKKQRKEL